MPISVADCDLDRNHDLDAADPEAVVEMRVEVALVVERGTPSLGRTVSSPGEVRVGEATGVAESGPSAAEVGVRLLWKVLRYSHHRRYPIAPLSPRECSLRVPRSSEAA